MSLATVALANASLFSLAACRIAGFVVSSPFPGQNVGRTQRVTLVVVLAWIATSLTPPERCPPLLGLEFFGRCAEEVGCGVIVGSAFRFVFSAAEVLGTTLGQASGIASASIMNPTLDATDTVFGRIMGLAAMLVALGAGIHRIALHALMESFRAIPIGLLSLRDAPALGLVDVAIDAFAMGVRLATPVLAVALLAHLALALVSRTAPSVQIFSVGFAVLFTVGTITVLACLHDILVELVVHFDSLSQVLDRAVSPLRP
ncbi:MAG: flagellar biosynthetic protein FliR [Polyangiaceae bacterium]|jgi:flagellar biosynthetic protein FliR